MTIRNKNSPQKSQKSARARAQRRTDELRDALRGLLTGVIKRQSAPPPAPTIIENSPARTALDTEPSTAFEALLRQQMQSLEQQLKDLRGRLNNLFLLIIGTVALQAIMRIAGL